jgi:hypothetical protein
MKIILFFKILYKIAWEKGFDPVVVVVVVVVDTGESLTKNP